MEQLAESLSKKENVTETTTTCQHRAHEALIGTTRFENHLYFNFQYHLEMIPPNARIITMRTEHLGEDWISSELAVGGVDYSNHHEDGISIPRINTGSNTTGTNYLNDNLRKLVCHELCNEIQAYKRILYESINLKDDQVQESMEELKRSCPVEAVATFCASPLPDNTEKLLSYRGYDEGVLLDAFTGDLTVGRSVHRIHL